MKKMTAIALISIALVSCKKGNEKVTKTDEKTGVSGNVETSKNSAKEIAEIPAITDSLGVFKQKFKLKKGETYPFVTYQKQEMTVTAPDGKSQSGSSEGTDEVSFTVNDFKDKIFDITINFIRKRTTQSGDGKTLEIDTQQNAPKEEALKKQWEMQKALIDNKLQMKMDENGKILSITGFEPVYAKILKTLSALTKDAKAIKTMQEQMKAGFNEQSLKEQFSKNILVIPAKGAKIGEKWTETENMTPDGQIKLTTTYTLKSVENGIVKISVSGGIPYKSEKQDKENMSHSMSSELSQNGTIVFDQNTGWIKNQNIVVKTTQKESISDGKETQNMTKVNTSTISVNPNNN
jgi:hypothetical protein